MNLITSKIIRKRIFLFSILKSSNTKKKERIKKINGKSEKTKTGKSRGNFFFFFPIFSKSSQKKY